MKLPITEQENPSTINIDQVSTLEAVRLINSEDKLVADVIERTLGCVAETIDNILDSQKLGGRLFYIGTGTSGRLGVLDASEIPPTFGVSPERIQGIIAGGYEALYKAVEASEDDKNAGKKDLQERTLSKNDAVIGIAASGTTPYTIGAVEYAKSIGCFTACITCNPDSAITQVVNIPIVAEVGAEAITGSTRMKAGTAQKMILNMISTTVMIKLGYVKGNSMVNLKSKNAKLEDRSLRILVSETNLSLDEAKYLFRSAKKDLRIALVMSRAKVSMEIAKTTLKETGFVIEQAIKRLDTTI